jgi:hypothetical protein
MGDSLSGSPIAGSHTGLFGPSELIAFHGGCRAKSPAEARVRQSMRERGRAAPVRPRAAENRCDRASEVVSGAQEPPLGPAGG